MAAPDGSPPAVDGKAGLRAHLDRWGDVYAIAIVSRIAVLVVGFYATYKSKGFVHTPFQRSGTFPHYADVVSHGYSLKNATEFPLLPMLLGGLHAVGLPLAVAALLVSNVLFLVGIVAFAALGERLVGRDAAHRSAWYLALLPTAWWFSIASTESAMLASLCLAALLALRGTARSWALAGAFAMACALTRPPGAFVGFVLLGIAISQYRAGTLRGGRIAAAVGALAAIPIAVGAFFAYVGNRTGDALAPLHAQGDFQRHLAPTGAARAVIDGLKATAHGSVGLGIDLVAAGVVVLLVGWFALHRMRVDTWEWRGWTAFAACSVLLPLSTGTVWQMQRFLLLVLPAIWVLGLLSLRYPRLHQAATILLPMALAADLIFHVAGAVPA